MCGGGKGHGGTCREVGGRGQGGTCREVGGGVAGGHRQGRGEGEGGGITYMHNMHNTCRIYRQYITKDSRAQGAQPALLIQW